jgi:hypothetical protein
MKLLAIALQQQPQDKISARLTSKFENNLGCLHLMLGKPNLGVFYFHRVLFQLVDGQVRLGSATYGKVRQD